VKILANPGRFNMFVALGHSWPYLLNKDSKDMRPIAIGALSVACNLVILFMGCSGAQTDAETSGKGLTYGLVRQGEPCIHDADCRSGFCNRNRCGAMAGLYGNQCD